MAKNKRPRKAYHRRPCRVPMLAVEDREALMSLLMDVEFAIYTLFPQGRAEEQHVEGARRIMNHCIAGMIRRRNVLDPDECAKATEVIHAANAALRNTATRRNRLFQQGRRDHLFVFTADELKAIEAGYVIASRFIEDSLDVCAGSCLKEYFVAMIIDKTIDDPKVGDEDAAKVVDSLYERLTNTPTSEWRNLR